MMRRKKYESEKGEKQEKKGQIGVFLGYRF
jgi:hypothetical protein